MTVKTIPHKGAPANQRFDFTHTFSGVELLEEDKGVGEDGKPKRQIVLTCLREGEGNPLDRRYYKRSAVEALEGKVYARRKVFADHLITDEQKRAGDSLRNWDATILGTWMVTESDGRVARKVRLKIHDDWLWRRCVDAPAEIALSIEGQGARKPGLVDGKEYKAVI